MYVHSRVEYVFNPLTMTSPLCVGARLPTDGLGEAQVKDKKIFLASLLQTFCERDEQQQKTAKIRADANSGSILRASCSGN